MLPEFRKTHGKFLGEMRSSKKNHLKIPSSEIPNKGGFWKRGVKREKIKGVGGEGGFSKKLVPAVEFSRC